MESIIYNQAGQEVGKMKLPEEVFDVPWNPDLVHQVVSSMIESARKPYAHTKTRGEVRGGGKKPWQQKGTGRARHGSIRSPLWSGGGVAHGPRQNEENFYRKVNKKMKAAALRAIFSAKARDGEILLVEDIVLKEPKTQEAKMVVSALAKIKGFAGLLAKKTNAALIVLPAKDEKISRAFSNFSNLAVMEARNLNPVVLLNYRSLVFVKPQTIIWPGIK
ncbi:MAG: large subunit ribosomal protein L4 [Parcubacteria group bacterium Gr01-1014_73]|nr:MAG: large subunit ribosomal protein L4 [Parcubacteria group bacterium Gr01-1014_73]